MKIFTPILVLIMLFSLSFSGKNTNYANVINIQDEVINNSLISNIQELPYIFNVGNKLQGDGIIKLKISKNQIKGVATGLGKTAHYKVDFLTDIDGKLNSFNGDIDLQVAGCGNPIGILIPGKIIFKGPLKGILLNEKLSLFGRVNIKGKLAFFAGFKNSEELLVEIPSTALAGIFKEIQKKEA